MLYIPTSFSGFKKYIIVKFAIQLLSLQFSCRVAIDFRHFIAIT